MTNAHDERPAEGQTWTDADRRAYAAANARANAAALAKQAHEEGEHAAKTGRKKDRETARGCYRAAAAAFARLADDL